MKIGLIRHFKVNKPFPEKRVVSQKELLNWLDEYEHFEAIEQIAVDLGQTSWNKCFASTSTRAAKTARAVYSGTIIQMDELKETQTGPIFKRNIRLPLPIWALITRAVMMTPYSKTFENNAAIRKRVSRVLDGILSGNGDNVLIVSHGILMRFMRRALLKRGFKGPRFKVPDNGRLYLFERAD